MRKQIIIGILALLLFQLVDNIFWRYSSLSIINSLGPYSTKAPEALFVILSIIGLAILAVLAYKSPFKTPIVIIIAGGASNLVDRFVYGGVVDYIYLFNISTVNLADIAITVSIISFIYLYIRTENRTS